jgi:homoserine acetyltransferase
MMSTDISRSFNGSMKRAGVAVKAEVLIVVASRDHMVNPTPPLEFAELLNAETLILESDCGHRAPGCESAKLAAAVNSFLK